MKINKKYVTIIMTMILFLISCGKKKETVVEETLRAVKTQKIENSSMSLGYTASGTIKGIEEIPYMATANGEIIIVNAKNGDYVDAGRVIISIDNQSARSNVLSASASYNEARINYEKYSQLYNKRLVTETEYLRAKTSYESARASLDLANDVNGKSTIIADISGVIANLDIEKHQQVSAGSVLFTIIKDDEMKLEVGVSPQVVEKIKVGTEAKVKIDELGEEVVGTVYEVASTASNSTKQFLVKIKIKNNGKIKSGMYGTASINTGSEQGLIIPKNAIVIRGVEQVVYIVKDGVAVAIPIKISNQNDVYAAVTGDGLLVGSELVIDGQNVLQTNEKVKKVN